MVSWLRTYWAPAVEATTPNGRLSLRPYAPPGWPSVIPRLAVDDPEALVQFLREIFLAEGEFIYGRPSELRIGDSVVMVGGTLERMPSRSFLYVYVPDVDEVYRSALAKGAESIEAPAEMPYGDRRAMFRDHWGNHWQVATHRGFGGRA